MRSLTTVPGVERRPGLEEEDLAIGLTHRLMLDAARHDQELAGFHAHLAVAKSHPQDAVHHQEQLILVLVVMPDEFPIESRQLHLHVVDIAGNTRVPRVVETGECVAKIDLVGHGSRDSGFGTPNVSPGRRSGSRRSHDIGGSAVGATRASPFLHRDRCQKGDARVALPADPD